MARTTTTEVPALPDDLLDILFGTPRGPMPAEPTPLPDDVLEQLFGR